MSQTLKELKQSKLEECIEVVKDVFKDQLFEFSENDYKELTEEIMDTCVLYGGDYDLENIRFYANEHLKNNFYYRFKKERGA